MTIAFKFVLKKIRSEILAVSLCQSSHGFFFFFFIFSSLLVLITISSFLLQLQDRKQTNIFEYTQQLTIACLYNRRYHSFLFLLFFFFIVEYLSGSKRTKYMYHIISSSSPIDLPSSSKWRKDTLASSSSSSSSKFSILCLNHTRYHTLFHCDLLYQLSGKLY